MAELTQRQTDVLKQLAEGKTYREIGAALGIAERTVEQHVTHAKQILRLRNHVQLARYAYREGLVRL